MKHALFGSLGWWENPIGQGRQEDSIIWNSPTGKGATTITADVDQPGNNGGDDGEVFLLSGMWSHIWKLWLSPVAC